MDTVSTVLENFGDQVEEDTVEIKQDSRETTNTNSHQAVVDMVDPAQNQQQQDNLVVSKCCSVKHLKTFFNNFQGFSAILFIYDKYV